MSVLVSQFWMQWIDFSKICFGYSWSPEGEYSSELLSSCCSSKRFRFVVLKQIFLITNLITSMIP